MAGIATSVLVAVGLVGIVGNGLPERYGEPEYSFFRAIGELSNYRDGCRWQQLKALDADRPCLIGDQSVQPSVVLWGDSHAEVLGTGLGEVLTMQNRSAFVFDKGGCGPFAGAMETGNRQRDRDCLHENEVVMDFLRASGIRTVVIAGRWDSYAAMMHFDPARGLVAGACAPRGDGFVPALTATLCVLREIGVETVVMRQVPVVGHDPTAEMYSRSQGRLVLETITFPAMQADYRATIGNHGLDAANAMAALFDPYGALCDAATGLCNAAKDGVPYYRDADHLSGRGAALVARSLMEMVPAKD